MKVALAYGQGFLEVDFPESQTTVIEPRHTPGLPDEKGALLEALDRPIGSRPLREWIRPGGRVCIVFSDITRPTPNHKIIPWLLEYLSFVPREQIVLLNGLGTHRPNTPEELARSLTPTVAKNYCVLNHEPENAAALTAFGTTRTGAPALINRRLAEADVRIITGFIEPHVFAGFSGGPKGIMPGVAGLATVMSNHGVHHIGHPKATFGVTRGNPLWEEISDIAGRVGPSFLLNVALNNRREITAVFTGDLIAAHRVGCEFVRRSAMQKASAPFDVVVTTNSGYPLDLNLYQGVKGMSAGARIVREGGLLILACECREGLPPGSPMEKLLCSAAGPEELLQRINAPGFSFPEQWQSQIQALVQRRARVMVYSSLPDATVRAAHLAACHDIGTAVAAELSRLGAGGRVAVLPQGPMTIPYWEG